MVTGEGRKLFVAFFTPEKIELSHHHIIVMPTKEIPSVVILTQNPKAIQLHFVTWSDERIRPTGLTCRISHFQATKSDIFSSAALERTLFPVSFHQS
jgi:hypothetical protein